MSDKQTFQKYLEDNTYLLSEGKSIKDLYDDWSYSGGGMTGSFDSYVDSHIRQNGGYGVPSLGSLYDTWVGSGGGMTGSFDDYARKHGYGGGSGAYYQQAMSRSNSSPENWKPLKPDVKKTGPVKTMKASKKDELDSKIKERAEQITHIDHKMITQWRVKKGYSWYAISPSNTVYHEYLKKITVSNPADYVEYNAMVKALVRIHRQIWSPEGIAHE